MNITLMMDRVGYWVFLNGSFLFLVDYRSNQQVKKSRPEYSIPTKQISVIVLGSSRIARIHELILSQIFTRSSP